MTDKEQDIPREAEAPHPRSRRSLWTRTAYSLLVVVLMYVVVAYIVMPMFWVYRAHRHPALETMPDITYTGDKHPGDPINVAIIGEQGDLTAAFEAAGWYPADRLGLSSDLRIAEATVLERSYDKAPVSSLFYRGHKQDLAFEQPVGNDPRQRHHVRFWKSTEVDDKNRPLWSGAATYDQQVGFSHTTGQITHHIAADVDTERNHLFQSLREFRVVSDVQIINDFHKVREGGNGGGDPWHTDGRLYVGTIARPADGK